MYIQNINVWSTNTSEQENSTQLWALIGTIWLAGSHVCTGQHLASKSWKKIEMTQKYHKNCEQSSHFQNRDNQLLLSQFHKMILNSTFSNQSGYLQLPHFDSLHENNKYESFSPLSWKKVYISITISHFFCFVYHNCISHYIILQTPLPFPFSHPYRFISPNSHQHHSLLQELHQLPLYYFHVILTCYQIFMHLCLNTITMSSPSNSNSPSSPSSATLSHHRNIQHAHRTLPQLGLIVLIYSSPSSQSPRS